MIRFKIQRPNGKIGIGFGLSAENINRLMLGQPMLFDIAELGIDAEVLIIYGETEKAIWEELKPMISEDTIIHAEP